MAGDGLWRSRWAAVGAAVAVTLGAGGVWSASASVGSGERAVFVPVAPCRIMDTRPGEPNRGPRSTPLAGDETHTIDVHGTNGDCTIPADASAVSLNVTSVNPSADSYLTVFPADGERPTASNLNWRAGQAPTPNAVVTDLSPDGQLSFYNRAGTVDVIADVNGYFVDHQHDDRYYTKAQVDEALSTKADAPSGAAHVLIGPAAFVPDSHSITYFRSPDGYLVSTVDGACFLAEADLADGATVTSITVRYLDNAAGGVAVTLAADPEGAAGPVEMAAVSSSTNSGSAQVVTDVSIAEPVVDRSASVYTATVCLDLNVRLYSMRIDVALP